MRVQEFVQEFFAGKKIAQRFLLRKTKPLVGNV
jgi:hypothetical protein